MITSKAVFPENEITMVPLFRITDGKVQGNFMYCTNCKQVKPKIGASETTCKDCTTNPSL